MLHRGLSAADGGFVPARLTLARAARGMKQKELAEKIARSPAAVSKWESDDYNHSPDGADIDFLASALLVQSNWFFKPLAKTEGAAFFRSLRSELKRERDKSEAKLSFVHEIFCALDRRVEFPSVDIPFLLQDNDYRSIGIEKIDQAANRLREYWGLGDDPIDDVMTIIENAGVVVADDFLVSAKLDGVSKWFDDRPVVLLAKDKNTAVRRRFDAAHELGHVVLHRSVGSQQLQEDWRLIEDQAMAFASAFLMPESSFACAVRDTSLDAIANLKPTWKVSIAAMIMRLKTLNLIGVTESQNLWKYYSYRQWRGNEPFDDGIDMEKPLNLQSAISMIAEEGSGEVEGFVSDTGLSLEDIDSLSGADLRAFSVVQREKPKLRIVGGREPPLSAND